MFLKINQKYLNLDKVMIMTIKDDGICFVLDDSSEMNFTVGKEITKDDLDKFEEGVENADYLNYILLSSEE